MRGTRPCCQACKASSGIIPALAGNTHARTPTHADHWDHPRACGEHRSEVNAAVDELGSSPRLRGTRAGHSHHDRFLDHPRACGEHYEQMKSMNVDWGSSPRLRGTLFRRRGRQRRRGIIPALAGNTMVWGGALSRHGDHPRACGEHCEPPAVSVGCAGSSPRLRGTRADHGNRPVARGIIPALAGNTHA